MPTRRPTKQEQPSSERKMQPKRVGEQSGYASPQMHAYSISIGARNSRTGGKRFPRADERLVEMITQKHFPDGFTITAAKGGWFDPKAGKFVKEESRQILVGCGASKKIARWCRALAIALDQDEIVAVRLGTISAYQISAAERRRSVRREQ